MKTINAVIITIIVTSLSFIPLPTVFNSIQQSNDKYINTQCPNRIESCMNRLIIEPSPIYLLYPLGLIVGSVSLFTFLTLGRSEFWRITKESLHEKPNNREVKQE